MNAFIMILFFGNITCFLIGLFIFLNPLKATSGENVIYNWKLHLILLTIGSILFFLYLSSSINLINTTTTISDGTTNFTITNNDYIQATIYLQLITAMFIVQVAFFIAGIIHNFELLGRTRFNG